MSGVAWVTANSAVLLGLAYAAVNLLNGVLTLAGSSTGWLGTVRKALDKISLITNKDAASSVKLPLTSSKPKE